MENKQGILEVVKMKKVIYVFIFVLLISVGTTNFARAAQTPAQVFESYYKAVKAGNFESMISYLASKLQEKAKQVPQEQKSKFVQFQEKLLPSTYTIGKTDINGNYATVHLKGKVVHPRTGEERSFGRVYLLKESGAWKIFKFNWKKNESDFKK
ncbi:MAG: DUF4878 domain-containing protein [Candidatus Eremiobacteraeota bacterium]|nr:DUF4878 domain-containing protein [Candidatus Eremiobacteraeota bacterium]